MDGIDVMRRPVRAAGGCGGGHWPLDPSPSPRILQSLLSYHLNQQVHERAVAGEVLKGGGVGAPTPPASHPGSPVPQAWVPAAPLTAPASPSSRGSPALSWVEYPYRDRCNSDSSSSSSSSDQQEEAGGGYLQHHLSSHHHHHHQQQQQQQQQHVDRTVSQTRPINLKKRPWSTDSTADDQPMDLSCPKKARPARIPDSPSEINCHVTCNNHRNDSCTTEPRDNVPRRSFDMGWVGSVERDARRGPPGPLSPHGAAHNPSILKSILCGTLRSEGCYGGTDAGAEHANSWFPQRGTLSGSTGLTRSPYDRVQDMINKARGSAAALQQATTDRPSTTTTPPVIVDQTNSRTDTAVTLAKKNLFPVRARVSDWLLKIVQFANSVPEFTSLPHNDKVTLILSAWARLLLIYMADTNFQFAVTPCRVPTGDCGVAEVAEVNNPPVPRREPPTMRTVEAIQAFIRKFQTLNLDSQEVTYMKLITLFHPGYYGMENAEYVETVNSYVRQSLQEHISSVRPKSDKLRYSQLLLCLPSLFGIRPSLLEDLFCKHISSTTDMEVLLKEMLQKL